MARRATFYTMWLLIAVSSMLVGWIVLTTSPVQANRFEAYKPYMPGEDAGVLLMNGYCESRYYESEMYYAYKPYLWCKLDDGIVRSAAVTMTGDSRIKGVYFFLVKCAVQAGDLVLWYDADIKAVRHGARLITWEGGQAATWYPRKSYWSPKTCLWGVWFEDELKSSNDM
jgi:hypothetical protein